MLEMRGKPAVPGDRSPVIFQDVIFVSAGVYDRLNGYDKPRLEAHVGLATRYVVGHWGFLMHCPTNSVAHKTPNHRKLMRFYVILNRPSDVLEAISHFTLGYSQVE